MFTKYSGIRVRGHSVLESILINFETNEKLGMSKMAGEVSYFV